MTLAFKIGSSLVGGGHLRPKTIDVYTYQCTDVRPSKQVDATHVGSTTREDRGGSVGA